MRSLLVSGLLVLGAVCLRPLLSQAPVSAGTAIRLDIPQLAQRADLIVEGRILTARPLEVDGILATEYLVEVERTFYGAQRGHRTIRLPGGVREDGSGLLLAGMPRVEPGDRSLLFLSEESANGLRMPVGLAQGKLDVVVLEDGTKRLVRDAAALTVIQPGRGKSVRQLGRAVFDYGRVVAQIQAGIARKRDWTQRPR